MKYTSWIHIVLSHTTIFPRKNHTLDHKLFFSQVQICLLLLHLAFDIRCPPAIPLWKPPYVLHFGFFPWNLSDDCYTYRKIILPCGDKHRKPLQLFHSWKLYFEFLLKTNSTFSNKINKKPMPFLLESKIILHQNKVSHKGIKAGFICIV